VKKDFVDLDLHREWVLGRVRWRDLISRNRASLDNGR